jgi:hypothetical protein
MCIALWKRPAVREGDFNNWAMVTRHNWPTVSTGFSSLRSVARCLDDLDEHSQVDHHVLCNTLNPNRVIATDTGSNRHRRREISAAYKIISGITHEAALQLMFTVLPSYHTLYIGQSPDMAQQRHQTTRLLSFTAV